MRAQEGTFRGLMTQDRQFRVPLYQRHYRWRTDQQRDLWQDILEQYRAVANPDQGDPQSRFRMSVAGRLLTGPGCLEVSGLPA